MGWLGCFLSVDKLSFLSKNNSMPEKSSPKKPSRSNLLEKLVPVLLVASIVLAFVVGILWQKVSSLEKGGATTKTLTGQAEVTGTQAQGPTQGKLSAEQAAKIPKVSDDDHIRGSRDAKVFLIEYSDLECPYCKRFHPTAQQVVADYNGQVAWVYRQFPLTQLHSKAPKEAEASECAAELGGEDGFWKFIDKVFEVTPSNNGLNLDDLPKLAGQVGLNQTDFKNCLDSGKYKGKVESQAQGGEGAGVQGTPANFIVNKKGDAWFLPGAYPLENVKTAIDEALK